MGRPRSWTDDDLREAVSTATTLAEVVRRLRLARGGGAYITVRTRMEQLGLRLAECQSAEDGPVNGHPPRRTWAEESLRTAVEQARSLNDVFVRLGLAVGGSQWLVIRSLILERGWSTEHWANPLGAAAQRASSRRQEFRAALARFDVPAIVHDARSRADVIRALGFTPDSVSYRWLGDYLRKRALGFTPDSVSYRWLGDYLRKNAISVAHFDAPHAAMRRSRRTRYRRSLDDILVANSTYTSFTTLKRRLIDAGLLEACCAICRIDQWLGRPITLHLDHINGVRTDHRIENLRLICPNCHSQTDTFAGRNKGSYTPGRPASA